MRLPTFSITLLSWPPFPRAVFAPHPNCLPRWHITPAGWPKYLAALSSSPDSSHLPLDQAAETFSKCLETADKTAFHLISHCKLRQPGKPWWNDDCAQTLQERWRAWNRWHRTPTLQTSITYKYLDAICARVILQSTQRTWKLIHAIEGTQTSFPIPLQDP